MENKLAEFIETNNANLDALESKCISRRLKRELINMYKLYDNIHVHLIQTSTVCSIIVNETVSGKRVCYKFEITYNYPFVCPNVFLNNHKYNNFLISNQNYEFADIKKMAGIHCFCCESITSLCKDKWSCRNTLQDIITEIKFFKNIKRKIILKLLIDKIKYKYLLCDIDIATWIF